MSGPAEIHSEFSIRPIGHGDDEEVAHIIRSVLTAYGATGPGFAIHDAEVSAMAAAYANPRRAYFVLVKGDRVVGGAGIAPLDGGPEDICELRKMYLLSEARGFGMGRALLVRSLDAARAEGFRACYLETLSAMTQAQRLYESAGFRRIDRPMGDTGHFGCNAWYLLTL